MGGSMAVPVTQFAQAPDMVTRGGARGWVLVLTRLLPLLS